MFILSKNETSMLFSPAEFLDFWFYRPDVIIPDCSIEEMFDIAIQYWESRGYDVIVE